MSRTAWLSLMLVAAPVAMGCRKAPKAETVEPVASSARSEPEAAPPPTASLDVGPSVGDRDTQQQAVFALLSGQVAADSLPEVATEQGQTLDHGLLDRLAPASDTRPRVRGSATIGTATSDASIANRDRVIAGMRAGFRSCYHRALAEAPTTAGVVSMVLKVARDGAVSDAKATSTTRLPAVMVSCLETRARAAQFDPPDGKAATVRFNVTFALQ